MSEKISVALTVNGDQFERSVEARVLLSSFLRDDLQLTGTHVGCEHGVCGACTVLVDGVSVRSCLMFAVQASGCKVTTIEGVAARDGTLHPLQTQFAKHHGLQCGFCTPGMVLTGLEMVERGACLTREEIRHGISGNLCRCTGYETIVDAIEEYASNMKGVGNE
jgi:aerobic-type carbon monoxide dehydrogenase small subunit (CoxS/CutS family)